ncbi:MAG: hypothetical protein AAB582_01005 [Patescibacteria group bacterium]
MTQQSLRTFGAVCGYSAAVLNAIGFVWYFLVIGETQTNPVTWLLWLVETGVSLWLYRSHTGDRAKWAAEAVSLIGVIGISFHLFVLQPMQGNGGTVWQTVEPIDYLVAILAIVALVYYWRSQKQGKTASRRALWIFQAALLTAILPLWRTVLDDPTSEPFWPWMIWTLAFVLQTFCAWLRWEDRTTLLNPINYAITHGVVALIVIL